MRKPRVFIASSSESLSVVDAININIDHQTEVTVWKNGFALSSNTIDALIEKSESVDFAIFIFTPDDVAKIRGDGKRIVRDNVLFELGLFTGTLGKERCFIVKPRDVELHFPTDLLGLTPADYDANRSDDDLTSAVNSPCALIKKEISKLGLISQSLDISKIKRKKHVKNFNIGKIEYQLLSIIMGSFADSPEGVSVWNIFQNIENTDKGLLNLAAIKLERLGYIDKSIDENEDQNHNFYVFSMTNSGIDYLLENEDILRQHTQVYTNQDAEEEIPF